MKNYHWLFWTLAIAGLLVDQASKYSVFAYLYNEGEGGKVTVIEGAFDLAVVYTRRVENGDGVLAKLRTISGKHMPAVNHGALFGIGSEQNLNRMFAMVSVLAAMAIIVFSSRPVICHDFFLSIALGLILGGTFGNLYDRIVFEGVRDFLHWYGGFNWPDFNFADCCLVTGALTLLAHAFFVPETKTADNAESGVASEMQSAECKVP